MTIDEAKKELVKFVELKTTLRPTFVDVLLEAEPVRHGKWWIHYIDDKPYAECSECGGLVSAYRVTNGYVVIYCPHCGARMDGVEERKSKKHNYWIKQKNGEYKCSNCGDTSLVALNECVTCKVKMDGVEE